MAISGAVAITMLCHQWSGAAAGPPGWILGFVLLLISARGGVDVPQRPGVSRVDATAAVLSAPVMRDRRDMMNPPSNRPQRTGMRRAVVLFPGGLTLGNLFFGIFAMISASRGEFGRAVLFIVCGGVCDMLDGRVARATNSGTEFGEQLDSLVDAISFGLAPAMITYFAVLGTVGARSRSLVVDPRFLLLHVRGAAPRAIQHHAGRLEEVAISSGCPSPAAGGTLATYHWFAQTPLYQQTTIGDLPWHELVKYLMIGLSLLMISNVRYPAFPAHRLPRLEAACSAR